MTARKWTLTPSLVGATFVISQIGALLFGHFGRPAEAKSFDDHQAQGITTQGASSFCTPIFGTGKSVGIPITVEDVDGSTISDISAYTFEVTDGTDSQDVTTLIATAQEQPLIVGQSLTNYGGYTLAPWGGAYHAYGTEVSATGPALDFSNPGYYFLDCTPNGNDASVKFASGITLNMMSGDAVVASVSLEGRAASFLGEFDYATTPNNPLAAAVKPAAHDNTDFENMYKDFIDAIGVRFRTAFATTAIMEMSNSTANSTRCWSDLVTASGSTWTWTTDGQSFLDELTSPTATSWPILAARTKGLAGPVDTGLYPCDMTLATFEDDLFIDALTAQLILIDGPRGNLPSALSSAYDAFAPASVLRLSETSTTSTVPEDFTNREDATAEPGINSVPLALATLLFVLSGTLVLGVHRFRRND